MTTTHIAFAPPEKSSLRKTLTSAPMARSPRRPQDPEAAREQPDAECCRVDHANSGERYARDCAYELRSSKTPSPTRNQPAKWIPPAGASTRTYMSVVQ